MVCSIIGDKDCEGEGVHGCEWYALALETGIVKGGVALSGVLFH